MYVLPTAPNVCSHTTMAIIRCQISTWLTMGTGFISTKLFFVLKSSFNIFAEMYRKKMLKMRVAVWHHTYLGASTL